MLRSLEADGFKIGKGLLAGRSLVDVHFEETHAQVFDSGVHPVWQLAPGTLAVLFVGSEGLLLGKQLEHDDAQGEHVVRPTVGFLIVSLWGPVFFASDSFRELRFLFLLSFLGEAEVSQFSNEV